MKTHAIARVFVCVLLLIGLLAVPSGAAYAQQADEAAPADDPSITIIIDDDGRVIVNGEEVSAGARVIRVNPDNGDVVVLNPDRIRARAATARGPMRLGAPDRIRFERDWAEEIEEGLAGLRFALPHVEPLMDHAAFIARESAAVMELERESMALARRVRNAEAAERAQLETELRTKLVETFEAKLQARQQRVQRLEEELNEQRNFMEERRRNQEDIIGRRMGDLLGDEDALDW